MAAGFDPTTKTNERTSEHSSSAAEAVERGRAELRRAAEAGALVLLEDANPAAAATALERAAFDLSPNADCRIVRASPRAPDEVERVVSEALGPASSHAPRQPAPRGAGPLVPRREPLVLFVAGADALPTETIRRLAVLANGSGGLVRAVLAAADHRVLLASLAGLGVCVDLVRLDADSFPSDAGTPRPSLASRARATAPAPAADLARTEARPTLPTAVEAPGGGALAPPRAGDPARRAAPAPPRPATDATPLAAAAAPQPSDEGEGEAPEVRRPAARPEAASADSTADEASATPRANGRRLYSVEELLGEDAWQPLDSPTVAEDPDEGPVAAPGRDDRSRLAGVPNPVASANEEPAHARTGASPIAAATLDAPAPARPGRRAPLAETGAPRRRAAGRPERAPKRAPPPRPRLRRTASPAPGARVSGRPTATSRPASERAVVPRFDAALEAAGGARSDRRRFRPIESLVVVLVGVGVVALLALLQTRGGNRAVHLPAPRPVAAAPKPLPDTVEAAPRKTASRRDEPAPPLAEPTPPEPAPPERAEPTTADVEVRVERAVDDLLGDDYFGTHEDAIERLVDLGAAVAGPALVRELNIRRRGTRAPPQLRAAWERAREALCESAARDPESGPPPVELGCSEPPR